MNKQLNTYVKNTLAASDVKLVEVIQNLWSGYGQLVRLKVSSRDDKEHKLIIAKQVDFSPKYAHPRGWNSHFSHTRKLLSYQVEMNWYLHWSKLCDEYCRVAYCFNKVEIQELSSFDSRFLHMQTKACNTLLEQDYILLLEDLNKAGFPRLKNKLNLVNMQGCLKWLAYFHARFMGISPYGLWQQGNYWHLATRPDEFEKQKESKLKCHAKNIEQYLINAKYQTIIHGDAKVANFCFSLSEGEVAAVDFQYVGRGCGIIDLMYFISSCLQSEDCFVLQDQILDDYFAYLKTAFKHYNSDFDFESVEEEWRCLYSIAWADFVRFLEGWSPNHWKIHAYSTEVSTDAISTYFSK